MPPKRKSKAKQLKKGTHVVGKTKWRYQGKTGVITNITGQGTERRYTVQFDEVSLYLLPLRLTCDS